MLAAMAAPPVLARRVHLREGRRAACRPTSSGRSRRASSAAGRLRELRLHGVGGPHGARPPPAARRHRRGHALRLVVPGRRARRSGCARRCGRASREATAAPRRRPRPAGRRATARRPPRRRRCRNSDRGGMVGAMSAVDRSGPARLPGRGGTPHGRTGSVRAPVAAAVVRTARRSSSAPRPACCRRSRCPPRTWPFASAWRLAGFVAFGVLVCRHSRVEERERWFATLARLNREAAARVARDWNALPPAAHRRDRARTTRSPATSTSSATPRCFSCSAGSAPVRVGRRSPDG